MEATVRRLSGFEDFYRERRSDVLRAVAFTLGDTDLAAEVTDEAFARAFERWSTTGSLANPSGWVYRVALNLARNRFRRLSLERRRPVATMAATVPADPGGDPALATALERLSIDQRAVVVLRFHLDWSIEEVAEALDLSIGTVKSRVHRALARLATILEDHR